MSSNFKLEDQPDILGPLGDSVVQRDYTRPNVQIQDVDPIPEAEFTTPTLEQLDSQFQQSLGNENATEPAPEGGGKKYGPTPVGSANPAMENLSKKEQKAGSLAMADAILDGYSQLKGWGNGLIKIDVKKVKKAINEGLINPGIQIPVDGRLYPLMEYLESYNSELDGTINVSPEFREKVHPVLVRVLQKHNVGMSDEQLLAYYFGTDIITTGISIFAIRSQNSQIIAQLKEMTAGGAVPAAPQSKTTAPKEPDPQPDPQPEPTTFDYQSSNERQFMEPEEVQTKTEQESLKFDDHEVMEELQPSGMSGKKSKIVQSHKIPATDTAILDQMERMAGSGVRTPRNKKATGGGGRRKAKQQ